MREWVMVNREWEDPPISHFRFTPVPSSRLMHLLVGVIA